MNGESVGRRSSAGNPSQDTEAGIWPRRRCGSCWTGRRGERPKGHRNPVPAGRDPVESCPSPLEQGVSRGWKETTGRRDETGSDIEAKSLNCARRVTS